VENCALKLEHITKIYPGVVALDDINLELTQGEVHAVVGENGAGKSTMMKLISGAIIPDEGTITVFNQTFSKLNPSLAIALGIELVYQEFNLVPNLSVSENIYLGDMPGGKLIPDFRVMEKKATELFTMMGIDIDPRTKVKDISTSYCQLVEIAKALAKNAKLLILDEPTASLTVKETEILFKLILSLKAQGCTILYVSHRLSEIFAVCDDVTIFRDGHMLETCKTSDITRDELVAKMAGRKIDENYPDKTAHIGDPILEVKNLYGLGVEDISFTLHQGEILGFAGLVGAGRTETCRVIFGADKMDQGEILFNGKPVQITSPEVACELGIGLVPEDRKGQGIILTLPIRNNISLAILKLITKGWVIDKKKENRILEKHRNALQIKTPSMMQLVKNLSGGNQQKVVLSKWLARECRVLIVDEPTRGIDVETKHEIYEILNRLAESGMGIIMISSEMPELIGMADRIVVLSEGHMTGILDREEFDQKKILALASHEFVADEACV
jgi:ribose transport system ATP-binding protein